MAVAECARNIACTGATLSTLDSGVGSELYSSLTIGTDGLGLISYHRWDATAARLMEANHVSGLPVVDLDQQLVGVLTEWELLEFLTKERSAGKVSEIMKPDVVTVAEDTPLAHIARTMLEEECRRVFVTGVRGVVGVVSQRDILYSGGALRTLDS